MSNVLKRFQLTTLAGCLGLALTVGAVSTAATADTADEIRAAQMAKISLKQAIDIASKQASGTLISAEFDDDDDDAQGGAVYELEFSDGSTEYEIKVDAMTGQIVGSDTDNLDSGDKDDYDIQRRAKIGVMAVIDAVEKQGDSRVLEIEFKNDRDYDDHPTYYEVDMLRDNQVIEVKINADTGREFERKVKN
ncbi:PepSY domain-containing protein [uncultured Psychrobacter sp.]|uniref:PepSY domain-containing protein n=1 Tax=uncultured Psychrobacter sp. TaxID=259303 RepID=UPI003458DA0F